MRICCSSSLKLDPQGFTLLELVVALALVGLVFGLVFGSFELISRHLDRGRAQLKQTNEIRTVIGFLRRSLQGQRDIKEVRSKGPYQAFSGDSSQIRFVAPMFPWQKANGLYEIRFRWTGESLLMDWRLFQPNPKKRAPFQHRLVSAQVTATSFRYYGRRKAGKQAVWSSKWNRSQRTPRAIQIALSGEKAWPPLVVRLGVGK